MAIVMWLVSYKIANNFLAHPREVGKKAFIKKKDQVIGVEGGEWISPSAVAE